MNCAQGALRGWFLRPNMAAAANFDVQSRRPSERRECSFVGILVIVPRCQGLIRSRQCSTALRRWFFRNCGRQGQIGYDRDKLVPRRPVGCLSKTNGSQIAIPKCSGREQGDKPEPGHPADLDAGTTRTPIVAGEGWIARSIGSRRAGSGPSASRAFGSSPQRVLPRVC